jgi:hypothetical protein
MRFGGQRAMHLCKITMLSVAITLMTSVCYADNNRVWAEQFVGRASTNWDLSRGTTEITDVYLQVVGPSNLADEVVSVVKACAEKSLATAFAAYYYAPGEASVKLAKAYVTFTAVFSGCTSLSSIASGLREKFNIGVVSKRRSENGIFATAKIENPTATLIDKYLIQNAPKGSRNLLSLANRIFYPAWQFPGEQSFLTRNLPEPVRRFGFFIPETPSEKIVRMFSDVHRALNLPKIELPKIEVRL